MLNEFNFFNITIFLAALVAGVILFYKRKFTYWQRRGVPILSPTIPFGDLQNVITRKINRMEEFCDLYNKAKAKGMNNIHNNL